MPLEMIRYETDGPIAVITLDRPDKLNAINTQMVRELNQALDRAEGDLDVRVIVLRGEGKAFSAGFDLGGGESQGENRIEALRANLKLDFDVIMRFWDSPKITIAAVHKYCLGSALEMAVACDITVAAEGCRFGEPEVKFGSGIVTMILPWLIGPKRTKELLLTGSDEVTAEHALEMGLVNRVVPAEDCLAEALRLARTIAVNDRVAVALTKKAINQTYEVMGMRPALLQSLELDVSIEASETPESREFDRIIAEEGIKAALAWQEARLIKR
jgi:enoyl-CoA hydratase